MSLHHALKAIDDLHTAVEQLALNVLPGTAMPYRTPTLSVEQREQADHRARAERLERIDIAPGDCPDPYRLEVVELLMQILVDVDLLNDDVNFALTMPAHTPAHSHMADPRPLLLRLRRHAHDFDEVLARNVESTCRRLTGQAAAILGLVSDGQHLPQDCPWCGTDKLRVRTLTVHDGPRPHVVCESDRCAPSTEQVGHWHRGRPAWDLLTEGEWLARCIEAVDASRVCRCGQPLPLALTGRPRRYCSPECKQDARRERDERMAS